MPTMRETCVETITPAAGPDSMRCTGSCRATPDDTMPPEDVMR